MTQKVKTVSVVSGRELLGYMAFNHATGGMTLATSYSIGSKRGTQMICNLGYKAEGTLFTDSCSAALWISRTIQAGRREWWKYQMRNGGSVSWRESDWKWLHRQTWSVVPVFRALPN